MSTAAERAHSRHQPTGCWCRQDKRLAIYLRDGFRCLYCLADLHGADPTDITLDHVEASRAPKAESVEEPEPQYLNKYVCPDCGAEWEDVWSCGCDDKCPECEARNISPASSELIG